MADNKTPKDKLVKIQYDRCNPKEVYAVIREFFPALTAKDFSAEIIFPFIPEGADTTYWLKMLRNVEYNLSNPKPAKRKDRRSPGKMPKGHNRAEQVTRLSTFDSLIEGQENE